MFLADFAELRYKPTALGLMRGTLCRFADYLHYNRVCKCCTVLEILLKVSSNDVGRVATICSSGTSTNRHGSVYLTEAAVISPSLTAFRPDPVLGT